MTFDYKYVRVFGAAAKKCYCGSSQCRGYISDSLKNKATEPMMLPNGGSAEKSMGNIRQKAGPSNGLKAQISESNVEKREERDKCTPALGKLEISTGKEDSINHSASDVSLVDDTLELDSKEKLPSFNRTSEISQQTEDVTRKLISAVHQQSPVHEETIEKLSSSSQRFDQTSSVEVLSKSLCDGIDGNRSSKSDTADDRLLSSKAHPNMKASRSSSIVKKGKDKSNAPNTSKVQLVANKSQVLHVKPKKAIESSFGSRFEAG